MHSDQAMRLVPFTIYLIILSYLVGKLLAIKFKGILIFIMIWNENMMLSSDTPSTYNVQLIFPFPAFSPSFVFLPFRFFENISGDKLQFTPKSFTIF